MALATTEAMIATLSATICVVAIVLTSREFSDWFEVISPSKPPAQKSIIEDSPSVSNKDTGNAT